MTTTVYYPDRDRRAAELNRARKWALLEIFRHSNDVMPTDVLRKWRKDELIVEILRVEFPPIPPAGTPVKVRQECTLPWLRGIPGTVIGRVSAEVAVQLESGFGATRFAPFELEVSR